MTYANVSALARILASTINDLIKYGPAKPVCQLEQVTTGTNLPSGTDTELPFIAGSEVFDDDNWHDTATNNTRVTPTTAGRYKVTCHGVIAANLTCTAVNTYIKKNGTVVNRTGNHKPNGTNNVALNSPSLTTYVDMNGTTDYLEMGLQQTSAAAAAQTSNISTSGRSTLIVELERAP